MKREIKILNLFRKVICSLLYVVKNTNSDNLKKEASYYLDYYLEQYKLYNDKGIYFLNDIEKSIKFCNLCYEDKDVFDFAEDVEYGIKELEEITKLKGEF